LGANVAIEERKFQKNRITYAVKSGLQLDAFVADLRGRIEKTKLTWISSETDQKRVVLEWIH
jgi:hypothetical protein